MVRISTQVRTLTVRFHAHEQRLVSTLVPYERNARTHSRDQVAQLVESIRKFGFTNPLLIDDAGRVIAGHGRLMAAKELGLESVPCIIVAGLSDAERRALILADNKLALNAGWDEDLLAEELRALQDVGFDLSLTGFSLEEIDRVAPAAGASVDVDDAPAVPALPSTRVGDIYLLGPHKLICGDSTQPAVLAAMLGAERADVVWTDPPYNVAYETAAGSIANDDMSDEEFRAFLTSALTCAANVMKPGAAIYVAHADGQPSEAFRASFRKTQLKLAGCLIWRKSHFTLSRSDYQWQHEPILYGWKPGSRHRWYGGRKLTSLIDIGEGSPFEQLPDGRWRIQVGDQVLVVEGSAQVESLVPSILFEQKPRRSQLHPTMKPVALIEKMLRNNARPGDLVFDPFGGSGSTLIAADRLGMCARLVELDPGYCDVIVQRWEAYAGRRAERVRA